MFLTRHRNRQDKGKQLLAETQRRREHQVRVVYHLACLEDTTQRKLWAYGDPKRRFSKRKKDELDLIRLPEAYPKLRSMYPARLFIDQGCICCSPI